MLRLRLDLPGLISMKELERLYVDFLLKELRFSHIQACITLDWSRETFYRHLRSYGYLKQNGEQYYKRSKQPNWRKAKKEKEQ